MRIFAVILLLMFIFSCGSGGRTNQNNENSYVMEPEVFVKVLKDYALVEGAINVNVLNVNDQTFDSLYHFDVMKKYGLTKANYDSTVMYYSARPDEFKKILEQVLEQLNKEKALLSQ